MAKNLWTDQEIELIKEFYPVLTTSELVRKFTNRSIYSIKCKAAMLGVAKAIGHGGKKKWNSDELEYIRIHYPNTSNDELMKRFECSEKSLYTAANLLKVRKTKEYKSTTFGEILKNAGHSSRFKPGQVAFNKGKKWHEFMLPEAQAKSRAKCFKKGNIPHNTNEIGHQRITKDGYIEIKVSDNVESKYNYKLKHRLVWEEYHGEIPKNHQVRFIDGDKTNFNIENLKLLSLADSLVINSLSDSSIVKRFLGVKDEKLVEKIINESGPLIELKRNALKLTKQLKQNERKN